MLNETDIVEGNKIVGDFMDLEYLDYDNDWRLLMPVWYKMRDTISFSNQSVQALWVNYLCQIAERIAWGTIAASSGKIIEAIKWYNQNK